MYISDVAITSFLQSSLLAAFHDYWEILITGMMKVSNGFNEKAPRLQKQKVLTLMSGEVSHCLTVWTFA